MLAKRQRLMRSHIDIIGTSSSPGIWEENHWLVSAEDLRALFTQPPQHRVKRTFNIALQDPLSHCLARKSAARPLHPGKPTAHSNHANSPNRCPPNRTDEVSLNRAPDPNHGICRHHDDQYRRPYHQCSLPRIVPSPNILIQMLPKCRGHRVKGWRRGDSIGIGLRRRGGGRYEEELSAC